MQVISNTLLPADGTRKAFYREFMKVVEAADVVIEVLDARDPLACRCTDVERIVRRSGSDKKVILLLNKIGKPSWLLAVIAVLNGFVTVCRLRSCLCLATWAPALLGVMSTGVLLAACCCYLQPA